MFSELSHLILWAAGVVILLLIILIGVVAYFLKEFHSDFKGIKTLVHQLVQQQAVQQAKGDGEIKLINHKIDQHTEDLKTHERRISILEEKL